MAYAGDPSAPPSRNTIIETVRNKNNKEDVRLRRRLTEYSKELATKIIQIDHDRLDAFDFLRQLRMCESDYMSEFAAFREEKAKLTALMERRDTMSTYSDDSEYDTPLPPPAPVQQKTTGQQTGAPEQLAVQTGTNNEVPVGGEASDELPGLTRDNTFVRMVFGHGRPSFLAGPMDESGFDMSPVQQKILHIQQEALLNNKDDKQRAAIMHLRAAAVAAHSHGGRTAREHAKRQRQRLRKPITRRIREFYDRVEDLVDDESESETKGETPRMTTSRSVIAVPNTA